MLFQTVKDHEEFTYLEEAAPQKPAFTNTDMPTWFEAVYLRENPKGRHQEYWHHALGCRMILKVTRDTLTHEIEEVSAAHPEQQQIGTRQKS